MSHFTCVVVSRDGEDPESLLEPYVESDDGYDTHPHFFEFQIEVEARDFEKTATKIVNDLKKDDEERAEWEQLLKDKKYKEIFSKWFGGEFYGGNWGYWRNPNAKWDWYAFGGRWAGYFKAKEGKTGEKGEVSWGREKWKYPEGYFDALNFEDIDWEGELEHEAKRVVKARQKASKEFDEWYKTESKKYNFENEKEKNEFDDKRKKKLDEFRWVKGVDFEINLSELVDRIYGNKNRPHAFITPDGKWHEEGNMGWWAVVSNEKPLQYREEWEKLLKESKPNDKFYLYDLHI